MGGQVWKDSYGLQGVPDEVWNDVLTDRCGKTSVRGYFKIRSVGGQV